MGPALQGRLAVWGKKQGRRAVWGTRHHHPVWDSRPHHVAQLQMRRTVWGTRPHHPTLHSLWDMKPQQVVWVSKARISAQPLQ